MANATTPSAKTGYRVVYVIHDGEHEYADFLYKTLDHEPSDDECAQLVVENYADDEDDRKQALQELADEGHFTMPCDYRIIDHIRCEPIFSHELTEAAAELAKAGQNLFDQINFYLFDQEISDQELPKEMTDAFDSWTAVMNRADGLS